MLKVNLGGFTQPYRIEPIHRFRCFQTPRLKWDRIAASCTHEGIDMYPLEFQSRIGTDVQCLQFFFYLFIAQSQAIALGPRNLIVDGGILVWRRLDGYVLIGLGLD